MLLLACVGRGAPPSLEYLTAYFSREFCHVVAGLLASLEGRQGGRKRGLGVLWAVLLFSGLFMVFGLLFAVLPVVLGEPPTIARRWDTWKALWRPPVVRVGAGTHATGWAALCGGGLLAVAQSVAVPGSPAMALNQGASAPPAQMCRQRVCQLAVIAQRAGRPCGR